MRNIISRSLGWAKQRSKLVIGVAAGVAVGGLTATTALAVIPDSSGMIHACYNTNKGDVRIIDAPSKNCKNNETAINWSSSAGSGGPVGLGQLVTSNFSNANLKLVDLRYRDFRGINFTGANLSQALFSHTNIGSANFTNADLSNADMIEQDLSAANLTGANMLMAQITNSAFGATNLNSTNLKNARITNTTGLAGHDYRGGIALGATFTNVNLTGANFAGLEIGSAPIPYPGITPGGMYFDHSNLTNANFSGITNAVADQAMTIIDSNISGAKFINANVPGRNALMVFDRSTGTNVDFTGANIRAAYFRNTNLTNVKFTNVDLSPGQVSYQQPARFFNAVLTNADFTNANLQGAIGFTTVTLNAPIWSNTTCPDGTNSNANGGTCIGHFPPEPFLE